MSGYLIGSIFCFVLLSVYDQGEVTASKAILYGLLSLIFSWILALVIIIALIFKK